MTPIGKHTLGELARGIAAGTIRAEALVEECLARIDQRESEVGAWTHVARDDALTAARARDQESVRSPLHGVPVAFKDVIDTYDMPTEYGSPIYKEYQPKVDAACVAMVRAAGGIVLGKTVTYEFAAIRNPVPTRNPRNLEHAPGGSSNGSAAAVADFMVPLAFGTQTFTSVTRPAAYCGVVGYKPTFGLINRAGVKITCDSLDTVGVLTRTVPDAALLVGVLLGKELGSFAAEAATPRIGFCRSPVWDEVEASSQTLLEDAVVRLARAGARVSEVELLPGCGDLIVAQTILVGVEGARALAHERRTSRDRIDELLNAKLDAGEGVSADDYVAARQRAERCRVLADEVFKDYDVLVTPSANGEAPRGVEGIGDPVFNSIWTVLQVPCVTVPAFIGSNGLPVGLQVVGPRFGDHRTLTYAEWVHRVLR